MAIILSAIYTYLLLRLAESWRFRSLSLYIDDGSIVASGATFRSSAATVAKGYKVVSDWLHCCSLTTDPDKAEFIAFRSARPKAVFVAGFARTTRPQEGITRETPKSTYPTPKAQL